jgi:hypothetical protein
VFEVGWVVTIDHAGKVGLRSVLRSEIKLIKY